LILVTGHISVSPEKVAELRPHIQALVAATRKEDGCLLYAFAEDINDPGTIRIVERWRDWAALEAHGYDAGRHRARQFDPTWFPELDLVVAFDRGHERVLREWAPTEADQSKVQLLLGFDPEAATMDVPDPYYSDAAMFDTVLVAIERACTSLFRQLEPAIRQGVP